LQVREASHCSAKALRGHAMYASSDAPEGRKLLVALGPANRRLHLIMDRAYEGDETR